jgi:hypothetical protein
MVIVGGGPAGLAPLLAEHRNGNLGELLSQGVAIIEKSPSIGQGSLGNYAINSDSTGKTFVDCLISDEETHLTRLADHPLTQQIRAAGDGTVPLVDAGRFLGLVGEAMVRIFDEHPASEVLTSHRASFAQRAGKLWKIEVVDLETGSARTLMARNLLLATGAHQPADRLAREQIGSITLEERCRGRLLQSNDVLEAGGFDRVEAMLAGKTYPKVAIVGGSTSAAAVANALLNRLPNVRFGEAGISLLHRRPLRIYYPTRQEALDEGYTEWTEDDVCPISGRVFRFAGFRLDSRELVMQARGIGGRAPEPRLRLVPIADDETAAIEAIDRADLVVAAMGYRPRALPIVDEAGREITLWAQTGPQLPLVDPQCRVLNAACEPIDNLFGIGLAAGFVPRGPLGGEASFRGQANGLWLWQHDVGSLVIQSMRKASEEIAAGSFVPPIKTSTTGIERAA